MIRTLLFKVMVFVFFLTPFLNTPKALAETIELKVSHYGPASWLQQTEVLEPWAKKIEMLTAGRVKFSFFPKETLGKGSELYDFAVKGITDIAVSNTQYTPLRFFLTPVMRLPFLGAQSGEQASLVLWRLYQKYLKEEFKDTHILWMFCHGPAHLHTTTKPVKRLEDLKGLRIRVGDPVLGQALELLGAIPMVITVTEGYNQMKEGKLDGIVLTWEGVLAFKYLELCKYHTEINMYTLPFFVAMNKQKYESLPADIQKIIDDSSGEQMSALSGRTMNKEDDSGRKIAADRGDFIYSLPKQELTRWKKITMPVGDKWVEEMEAKGLPGQEVLAYAVDLFIQIQK